MGCFQGLLPERFEVEVLKPREKMLPDTCYEDCISDACKAVAFRVGSDSKRERAAVACRVGCGF